MTWFTIFTTLLAVQFIVGISGYDVITRRNNHAKLRIQDGYGPNTCELESNTGQKYHYAARNENGTITDRIFREYGSCSIQIAYVQWDDAGSWKITTFFQNNERPPVTQEFKLYVSQEVEVEPYSITITEGYFARVKLIMDKKNVTNCTLILDYSKIDLLNEPTENFQRFGQCGFRMLANVTMASGLRLWRLEAVVEDKFIYIGDFKVEVRYKMEEREMPVITLDHGKSDTLALSTSRYTTFCQLEGPMGLKTPFYQSCYYKIPVVTSRHGGVWIARYGIRNNPVSITERFRVIVRDETSFHSNVTVTENKEIQMFCHVYDKGSNDVQFCHFTRPDGYTLNVGRGIGTESYNTYTVVDNQGIHCGLVIHQLEQHDYGVWKCGIHWKNQFYAGSIIYVDPRIINANETRDREITVVAETVYVKRNDLFQIKCTADAVLSYCWFRSPNGTSYSVSKIQGQSPTVLPYVGLGLRFGECIVQVDHATYTDHGHWTCNVGVLDGPEISRKFIVNVVDSDIIPERSVLAANGDNLTLTCNILPNQMDKEIRYCRWIHPDGHGIHDSLSHRYVVSQTDTQCKLMIASEYSEESVGRWICVAGLNELEDKETWSTIDVLPRSAKLLN